MVVQRREATALAGYATMMTMMMMKGVGLISARQMGRIGCIAVMQRLVLEIG